MPGFFLNGKRKEVWRKFKIDKRTFLRFVFELEQKIISDHVSQHI